jgi:hypothetical protein
VGRIGGAAVTDELFVESRSSVVPIAVVVVVASKQSNRSTHKGEQQQGSKQASKQQLQAQSM